MCDERFNHAQHCTSLRLTMIERQISDVGTWCKWCQPHHIESSNHLNSLSETGFSRHCACPRRHLIHGDLVILIPGRHSGHPPFRSLLLLPLAWPPRNVGPADVVRMRLLVDLNNTSAPHYIVRDATTHRISVMGEVSRVPPMGVLGRARLILALPYLSRLLIHLLVLRVLLFFDARSLFFFIVLVFARIASSAHSRRHRATALHLFARNEVSRAEHAHIVPPLHHVVVRASPGKPTRARYCRLAQ